MNDQFTGVDHVDHVDRVEPLVVYCAGLIGDLHFRQQLKPDLLDIAERRAHARCVFFYADLFPHQVSKHFFQFCRRNTRARCVAQLVEPAGFRIPFADGYRSVSEAFEIRDDALGDHFAVIGGEPNQAVAVSTDPAGDIKPRN